MWKQLRLLLSIAFLIFIAPLHLPAPIVEEEKATPAPEEQAKPQTKHSKKTKSEDSESAKSHVTKPPEPPKPPPPTGSARFAGPWTGKFTSGPLGRLPSTLTVDATASSVELSQNLGGGSRRATAAGDTLTWHAGILGEVAWTLTLNSDGQTAQVTMKGLFGHNSQVFRRGLAAPAETTQATATPPARSSTSNTAQVSSAAGGSLTGPRPEYSQAARSAHLSGKGTYLLHLDTSTGSVTDVTVSQSTGSAVLDQAAISAFRQWHAQPNCPKEMPLTISFP